MTSVRKRPEPPRRVGGVMPVGPTVSWGARACWRPFGSGVGRGGIGGFAVR